VIEKCVFNYYHHYVCIIYYVDGQSNSAWKSYTVPYSEANFVTKTACE